MVSLVYSTWLNFYLPSLKKYSLSSFWSFSTRQWHSPNSSRFSMFRIQNLGETHFTALRRYLLFLPLLKRSSKRSLSSKEASILFCMSLLVFSKLTFLNFVELVLSFCSGNYGYLILAHEIKNQTQILFHLISR